MTDELIKGQVEAHILSSIDATEDVAAKVKPGQTMKMEGDGATMFFRIRYRRKLRNRLVRLYVNKASVHTQKVGEDSA